MNERTEQQIQQDKEAIASMQRAPANMTKALARIKSLEQGLETNEKRKVAESS